MLISKKTRIAVYSYLFKEGTLVAKKDVHLAKHSDEVPFSNLEVLTLLKSFRSKGYVKETFNWQYYYYYLTNEGINYLRQYLALPVDIVPATLKKLTTSAVKPSGERREGGYEKKSAGDFNPEFQKDRGNREGYRN
eukprot:gene7063-9641_t